MSGLILDFIIQFILLGIAMGWGFYNGYQCGKNEVNKENK